MLTVATIMRESLQTTLSFTAWYRAQGADRIIIHFDNPDDPAIRLLSDLPWITAVPCTNRYWKRLGASKSDRFTLRQNLAVTAAYNDLAEGWFLNVDGDELLHLEGRTAAQELEAMPDDVRAVQFLPAEHVHTPEEKDVAHFRLPMGRRKRMKIYGTDARAMRTRRGLVGHYFGKSATRAGLTDVSIRQHWAQDANKKAIRDRTLGHDQEAYLLHFVDQNYSVWREKLDWRLKTRGFRGPLRKQLLDAMHVPDPEPLMREIYNMLHVFEAPRLRKLKRLNACVRVPICHKTAIDTHLPHLTDIAFPKELAG